MRQVDPLVVVVGVMHQVDLVQVVQGVLLLEKINSDEVKDIIIVE